MDASDPIARTAATVRSPLRIVFSLRILLRLLWFEDCSPEQLLLVKTWALNFDSASVICNKIIICSTYKQGLAVPLFVAFSCPAMSAARARWRAPVSPIRHGAWRRQKAESAAQTADNRTTANKNRNPQPTACSAAARGYFTPAP